MLLSFPCIRLWVPSLVRKVFSCFCMYLFKLVMQLFISFWHYHLTSLQILFYILLSRNTRFLHSPCFFNKSICCYEYSCLLFDCLPFQASIFRQNQNFSFHLLPPIIQSLLVLHLEWCFESVNDSYRLFGESFETISHGWKFPFQVFHSHDPCNHKMIVVIIGVCSGVYF